MAKKKPGRTAGLTNDPAERKAQHGNPDGFRVIHEFRNKKEARNWEEKMLGRGYDGGTGGAGWRFGYTFKNQAKKKRS